MSEQIWADIGLAWVSVPVRKQAGDHATDRRTVGNAQVPTLVDIDKAVAAGLKDAIVSSINRASSWRVLAQDVARRMLDDPKKRSQATPEKLREMVFNRLRSIHNVVTSTQTVEIHRLPDGTEWTSAMGDEIAYRAEALAQYIDLSVEMETAKKLVGNMKW